MVVGGFVIMDLHIGPEWDSTNNPIVLNRVSYIVSCPYYTRYCAKTALLLISLFIRSCCVASSSFIHFIHVDDNITSVKIKTATMTSELSNRTRFNPRKPLIMLSPYLFSPRSYLFSLTSGVQRPYKTIIAVVMFR